MGIFDFFKKKKTTVQSDANLRDDNGLNIIHAVDTGEIVYRFHMKEGKIDGLFEYYPSLAKTNIIANFVNGKLHGECKEWSPSRGCYHTIEIYEDGELRLRRVIFSYRNDGTPDSEQKFSSGSDELGFIAERIRRFNFPDSYYNMSFPEAKKFKPL